MERKPLVLAITVIVVAIANGGIQQLGEEAEGRCSMTR